MFCRKCGKLVKDNAKFCGYCGAEIAAPEPAPADGTGLEGPKAAIAGTPPAREPERAATEPFSAEMPEGEAPTELLSPEEPEEAPTELLSAEMPENGQTGGLSARAAEGGEQTPPRGTEAAARRRITFCKQCGTPIEEGLRFCRVCGAETQWGGNCAPSPPVSGAPETPPARKVTAEHRAINVAMSVLLSILLFVFTLSSFALLLVKPTLDKVDFKEMLSDTDLTGIEVPVDGEKTRLVDYIYDLCTENAPELHLTRKAVEQVLSEDFIRDFAGEVIDEYRAYLLGDDNVDGLTRDRALDFVRKNEKKILRILENNGIENAEIDYDELERQLDENFASLDLKSDMGSGVFGVAATVVNRALPAIAIAFAALAGLFFLLLIVLNASHVTAMLNHIGIPVGLAGLTGLAGGIALRVLGDKIEASDPLALAATDLIDTAKLQLMLGGAILLAAGILLVAVMTIHHVLKKRRRLD